MNITLVGCGKMGSALLSGWRAAGIVTQAFVIDPAPPPFSAATDTATATATDTIHHFPTIDSYGADRDAVAATDMIVLAVKPQIMDDVCAALKDIWPPSMPLLSIAAGRTLSGFAPYCAPEQPLIRAMPNTPAAIGHGITALVANAYVDDKTRQAAQRLMNTTGQTLWLDDEGLMDAVTALSGSGPAYIFLLIEILTQAGETVGLPAAIAAQLARQTVVGSAALAAHEETTPAATLRANVTSPGGTTAAALEVLMRGELQALFDEALAAARARGAALAKP